MVHYEYSQLPLFFVFLLKKESTRVCTLKALFNFQDTCVIIVLSFEGTFILYHILEILSTPFFEVFSNFFFCDRHSLSTATLISYHISSLLSRPFSKKTFRFSSLFIALVRQLYYYITLFSFCQQLFSRSPFCTISRRLFAFLWLFSIPHG